MFLKKIISNSVFIIFMLKLFQRLPVVQKQMLSIIQKQGPKPGKKYKPGKSTAEQNQLALDLLLLLGMVTLSEI